MNNRDGSVPASEASVEAEIRQKGLTAPRITPEHIDAQIVGVNYFVPGNVLAMEAAAAGYNNVGIPAPLACLTICVLVLANGFTVTGESSCASPENFDAELGRKIAFRNARDKIWQLEGYVLRTRLADLAKASDVPPVPLGTDANGSPVGDERYGAREG